MDDLELNAEKVQELLSKSRDIQFIDIREPGELPIVDFQGLRLPLSILPDHVEKIAKDKPVIIFCRSGARSLNAVKMLREHFNLDNIYSLKGGILDLIKSKKFLLDVLQIKL